MDFIIGSRRFLNRMLFTFILLQGNNLKPSSNWSCFVYTCTQLNMFVKVSAAILSFHFVEVNKKLKTTQWIVLKAKVMANKGGNIKSRRDWNYCLNLIIQCEKQRILYLLLVQTLSEVRVLLRFYFAWWKKLKSLLIFQKEAREFHN